MLDFLWGMFLLCNSEKLSSKSHHIIVFWYIAHYLRNKFFRDFSDTMLGSSIFFCSLATIKVSYSEFCVSKPVEAFISLIVVWSFQLLFNKKQYKITMVNDYLPIAQKMYVKYWYHDKAFIIPLWGTWWKVFIYPSVGHSVTNQ